MHKRDSRRLLSKGLSRTKEVDNSRITQEYPIDVSLTYFYVHIVVLHSSLFFTVPHNFALPLEQMSCHRRNIFLASQNP